MKDRKSSLTRIFDHDFVRDYYNGISIKEAEKRIQTMLKNTKQ